MNRSPGDHGTRPSALHTRPGCGRMLVLLVALALLSGCSVQPAGSFVLSEDAAALPENHQQQIEQILRRYYGTPANPRLMEPAEEQPEEERANSDEEQAEEPEVQLVEQVDRQRLELGARLYTQRCAPCHGTTGDGAGPAAPFLNPKPRDYRQGIFKFTSTPQGPAVGVVKPRRVDLIRTITWGAKGTSMPSFRWLAEHEKEALVDYVILLSQRGELERELVYESDEMYPEDNYDPRRVAELASKIVNEWEEARQMVVRPLTQRPEYTDHSIRLGREAFLTIECWKCHGRDGRGQTQQNVGKDVWGHTVYAADLTTGMLHGGRRPIDVYRRIYMGIKGTPMPSFQQRLADQPDTIWHLTHYILSIVEDREVDFSGIKVPDAVTAASGQGEPGEENGDSGDNQKDDNQKDDTGPTGKDAPDEQAPDSSPAKSGPEDSDSAGARHPYAGPSPLTAG